MASTGTIPFNGSSTYSSDFQTVLNRAVQLASLPMQQMQNHVNDLTRQESDLANMEATFISLQGALQNITTTAQGTVGATASDLSVLSIASSATALPGKYTIQVTNAGSSTTTSSIDGLTKVSDPTATSISSSSSFTLTVNGKATTITPAGSSLQSLAAALNAADAGVQATIVNLGGSAAPDYRLALTSTQLGSDTIQLNDGSQDLLSTLSTGVAAQYTLNGGSTTVQSTSSQVTIAPGLTVNLKQANPSETVTITVSSDFTSLQNALSNFVSSYNAAVDALTQERGQNGGALAGQSIVLSLTGILNQVAGYSGGSGSVSSLADLGLDLDQTGHLSFSSSIFASQSTAAIQQFLGSATSGFLQAATNSLTSATDSTTGIIQMDSASLQDQIDSQNSQIADEQTRVTDLQNSLQQQLAAADAVIANLQAQKQYYTSLFAAEFLQNSPFSGQ